jgi:signal transduction histidine kinase/ActR/RegA family two-component response regulator
MYASHRDVYALLFVVQIACAGVLLHTRLVLATVAGILLVGGVFVVHGGAAYAGLYISVMLLAAGNSLLIHALMRRALVRAIKQQSIADDAAAQLALRIEELQRSQEEKARLHEQLLHAQRMEAVGTLAAGLAHDMNNVLAAITGLGTLLLEELPGEQARDDVEQILEQTERGASLTRSLLAFSRRGQYRKRAVRLWDVVRGVIPILERTLPKSIDICCELRDDAVIDADPKQLEQVLINLALNARDAMPSGGVLTIAGELVGEQVRLRVGDTGIGMDEATRLRVFEPFFTTKALGKGTGLGLSMVWGSVQAHEGSIAVDSRPGHGATFTIAFPLSQGVPIALTRAVTSQQLNSLGGRVLIVDDERGVRETSKRLLERLGLQVVTAQNGIEALDKFAAERFDLVVLDMGMPGMGGAECFARLRERSQIPILIATGYAIDEEAQTLVAQGAALLEKPFSSEQLRREVGRMLAHGRRLGVVQERPLVRAERLS